MTEKVTILERRELAPFFAKYLTEGYRREVLILQRMRLAEGFAEGEFLVQNGFVSEETGVYHFTVPSAIIAVSQLAIVYGCWDHDLEKKQGEHYLRGLQLRCKKEITTTRVVCTLRLRSKRNLSDVVLYSGYLSVDDDAFIGSASFVMPRPNVRPPIARDSNQ